MENITHSLVGAALAEVALPANATSRQRRLFFVTGIVAANLPDGDLVYSRIAPPPLGYLLHHRGHTHTIVGCAVLALLIWLVVQLIPPARRAAAESPGRLWALIGGALASHLVLDSWNSYGVHPFWPVDNRWYYGDAINIIEPWLWVFLGVAAMNTRSSRGRVALAGALVVLVAALAWIRMISVGALVALALGGIVLVFGARKATPRRRSAGALLVTAAFVSAMLGLNRIAHGASLASLRPSQQGEIVDVVLSPNVASPLCWRALAVENNERGGEYVLRRGSLTLFAGWLPRPICGSDAREAQLPVASRTSVVWFDTRQEPLDRLRRLAREDCWVRGWLQFGRAPTISDGRINDLRFGNGSFSEMQLRPPAEAASCPPHLTNWTMPRADLVGPGSEN